MTKKVKSKNHTKPGFFERTSMYGFELFMALFGLTTTLIVVDYGIFALCNYFRGVDESTTFVGSFTLWIVAALIVWLPVTLFFYLRSRSASLRNPAYTETLSHRVLTSIYYACVLIGAIGLMFGAVYSLFHLAVTPDETAPDVLLRLVVPALIAVVVHIGMMFAYAKSGKPGRILFASLFGVFAVVVAVSLFAVSASSIRSARQDDITVNDLATIHSAVTSYAVNHANALPSDVSALNIPGDTKDRLSKYSYTKVDAERYELCADFGTDTTGRYSIAEPVPVSMPGDSDGYTPYANFFAHAKGHVCFKERFAGALYDAKSVTSDTLAY